MIAVKALSAGLRAAIWRERRFGDLDRARCAGADHRRRPERVEGRQAHGAKTGAGSVSPAAEIP